MKRKRESLDQNWFFSMVDLDDYKKKIFDHSSFEKVNIPHDWSTKRGYSRTASSNIRGGFVKTGIGWYRKSIIIKNEYLDKEITIQFDGVFANSDVYVNGEYIGHHTYGYTGFEFDISKYVNSGINTIAVRVDCEKQPASRWYNGCGIYRHVWLNVYKKCRVFESFVHSELNTYKSAKITIETKIKNSLEKMEIELVHEIYDKDGAFIDKVSTFRNIGIGEIDLTNEIEIENPLLWGINKPYLYSVITKILNKDIEIDQCNTVFGIRKIEFVKNKGFYLNGKNLKLKGVCLHQDAGVVGGAVQDCIWEKRIRILKDMGCNAIRTAHHPFAPIFYELCDKLGMMVMDEIFDGWDVPKVPFEYSSYFNEYYKEDLEGFIKRDRNHPCVIMWSIGNEVLDMKTSLTKELSEIVYSLDPTRALTCGINGVTDNADKNRALLDIAGYNDGGGACYLYDRDHKKRPSQLMVATEAPHTYQTRGFYRTQTWWRDKNLARIEIENLTENELFFDGHLSYRSSYDNSGVRTCIRDSYTLTEERPFLIGEFRWTGFDYYGESYGWPAKWTDHGVIGVENFKKDSYYLYKSMWNAEPMVHMLPHWTHLNIDEGTLIPIIVYTNCNSCELFLNDKSLGAKKRNNKKQLRWFVPYISGIIEAVGYNEKGDRVVSCINKTASDPFKLKLSFDEETLFTKKDVVQLSVDICDENDIFVPYANNTIYFKSKGNYDIIGTENGDCVDMTPLNSDKRKAFYGKCMALLKVNERVEKECEIFVASIIGRRVFKNESVIAVDFRCINIKNKEVMHEYEIKMRLNNEEWFMYDGSVNINETTMVEALVYCEDELIFQMDALFIKGEKEKVIDLDHGNISKDVIKPNKELSEKIKGIWYDGDFPFLFNDEGELYRILNKDNKQHIGYWWFEGARGEIHYLTGEISKMILDSEDLNSLIINNENGAIKMPDSMNGVIILKREYFTN